MKTVSTIVPLLILVSLMNLHVNTLLAQSLTIRNLQGPPNPPPNPRPNPPNLVLNRQNVNILKTQDLLFDGVGNNQAFPNFNTVGSSFRRLVAAAYPDGVSAPITNRPSARVVSNDVGALSGAVPIDIDGVSVLFTMWGQFLDHDLDLSSSQPVATAQFFNINVPAYDQTFGVNTKLDPNDNSPNALGTKEISFRRSIFTPGQVPRIPTQQLTGWHDASQIYGSTKAKSDELRSFVDGKLKVTPQSDGKDFLPKDANGFFFVAGDVRANQNVLLTIIHTIWLRQHNRLCDEIKQWDAPKPSITLTDDEIYTIARKIVTGLLSKITYNDWLPHLLGPEKWNQFIGEYSGYDATVDPRIPIQFANAGFRIGHPLLVSSYQQIRADGTSTASQNLNLSNLFSNPNLLSNTLLENLLRGIAKNGAKEKNCNVVDDVRNLLVLGTSPTKVDLFSLNVQRGRQTGLPSYNQLRVRLGITPSPTFTDVTNNADFAAKLSSTYGDISKLDPWVGIICENAFPRAVMGRLGAEIAGKTFQALRNGDRFWYERTLPPTILNYIKGTTFADVIERNTGIKNLQRNVFLTN